MLITGSWQIKNVMLMKFKICKSDCFSEHMGDCGRKCRSCLPAVPIPPDKLYYRSSSTKIVNNK